MKTTLLLLVILLFSNVLLAQTTAIPDTLFEQELINLGLDAGTPDGVVLTANIDTLSILNVSAMGIYSLTGIEDFASLERLFCLDNSLSALNVTQNSNLKILQFGWNQITNIDLSQNPLLENIWCNHNPLISLDLSQNPLITGITGYFSQLTFLDVTQCSQLDYLNISVNQLTSLDLSLNPLLKTIAVNGNQLSCLNIKNTGNTNITLIYAMGNPNLTCIQVDDTSYSNTNWIGGSYDFGLASSFSTSCSSPCTVGIDELTSSSISIHPNPTSGQITISLEEGTATSVTIRNSLGQILLSDNSLSGDELDISTFPTGIYLLQIESDGQVITKKVVKK